MADADDAVQQYILDELDKGFKERSIREVLVERGYPSVQVAGFFLKLREEGKIKPKEVQYRFLREDVVRIPLPTVKTYSVGYVPAGIFFIAATTFTLGPFPVLSRVLMILGLLCLGMPLLGLLSFHLLNIGKKQRNHEFRRLCVTGMGAGMLAFFFPTTVVIIGVVLLLLYLVVEHIRAFQLTLGKSIFVTLILLISALVLLLFFVGAIVGLTYLMGAPLLF